MRTESPFLFDNREYFYYGEVTSQHVEYLAPESMIEIRKIRNQSKNFFVSLATVVAIGSSGFIKSPAASSPAHIVIKSAAKVGEQRDEDLRRAFIKNRDFLGLKQKQIAQILGLSESTIEKFEQGVYATQELRTKELIGIFNEWVSVLNEFHGDRKFIVRPFIRVKMNALGDISPLEYAIQNPVDGLYDLIGLERKMYG